jgi:hypothetical protein
MKIRTIITIVIVIVIAVFLYGTVAKIFSFPQLPFLKPKVERYDGNIIIQNIKSILELYTQKFYTEIVEDSGTIVVPGIKKNKRLVMIVKGRVMAGFDLAKLEVKDIDEEENRIALRMDSPFKVETETNPTDFELFRSRGHWPPEEIDKWKVHANNRIRNKAIQKGILEKCETNGRYFIENFLKNVGFEQVSVEIVKNKEFVEIEENFKNEQKNMAKILAEKEMQAKSILMAKAPPGVSKEELEKKVQKEIFETEQDIKEESYFKKTDGSRMIKVADVRVTTDKEGKIIKTEVVSPVKNEGDKEWLDERLDFIKSSGFLGDLPKSKTFTITLEKRKWE